MSDTSLVPLMARVGFLFLQWGMLEHAVRESGVDPEKGDTWQSRPDLQEARALRNLIAHGIICASADPDIALEPHIVCASRDGAERCITFSELDDAIRVIERERGRYVKPKQKRRAQQRR